MTQTTPGRLQGLFEQKPLSTVSAAGRRQLEEASRLIRFEEGQILSPGDTISDTILLLLEGEARPLAAEEN